MIILDITNASELIASKAGKLIEKLTPDLIDQSIVEDLIVNKMIENLCSEGIKGEISVINGASLEKEGLIINEGFKVNSRKNF